MNQTKAPQNVIKLSEKIDQKKGPAGASGPRVISIASGKGGVGKTNIVANLGHSMSKMGKKVLIFDADLGLGNLDILLGLTPKYNLSHFITGEQEIEDIIVDGPAGMKIIPAASGIKELVSLTGDQKVPIINKFNSLMENFDVFLIDTAAGISNNVLHFAAVAQDVMVIVTPEPTSLTDAYALIKVLSFHHNVREFNLVVNMVASEQEAQEVFGQLQMVTGRFLDVDLAYSGHILMDRNITKGVRRQKIVSEMAPEAEASRCFATIAKSFLEKQQAVSADGGAVFKWHQLLSE